MQNKSGVVMKVAGAVLIVAAVVLLAVFLVNGQTQVGGAYPAPVTSKTLVCETSGLAHPVAGDKFATSSTMKINAIIDGEKLKVISLIYTTNYADEVAAEDGRNEEHAAMNLSYADEGLEVDALGASYSRSGTKVTMSLYATANEVNSVSEKYLLLDGLGTGNYTAKLMKTAYEQKGFKCIENN